MTGRAIVFLLAFLLAASAFAHAGHHHVFGTVKQLSGDALLVHTREGTDTTISLTKATVYKRGDADAKRADLVPGVRVVIDMRIPELAGVKVWSWAHSGDPALSCRGAAP